ncbi:ABC transporter ATP-binding protein [Candidatus Latescibacterota bacterium]
MNANDKKSGKSSDTVKEYSSVFIIKRLFSYLKPYRKSVLLALMLSIISTVLYVVRPYLIKIVIDEYIADGDINGLKYFMIIFVIVYFMRLLIGYFMNMITGMVGQQVMHDLRMKIFGHILSMEMSFFDHNKVGRLMTRTTGDVAALNELFTSGAVRLINNSGILIGIVLMMFYLDWKLSLVTLITSPLIFGCAYLFSVKIRVVYRNIRMSTARINAFLQENIQGIRVIKQMMRVKWSMGKFSDYSHDLMKLKIKNVLHYGLFFPAMEFIGVIGVVLILSYGGQRIYWGTLQLGVMIAFLRLVEMFFMPVREMAENYNVMLSAMAASERIFTLLDTKSKITQKSSNVPHIENSDIVFENVWFAYDDENWILKDVSFRVSPGERVAFVGPTGAGKTSIISLLLRFYDVNKGRILIGGKDIRDVSLSELRGLISHVGQDPFLFNRSISENITLDESGLDDARIHEVLTNIDVDTFFENLEDGLDTVVMERGSRLSQGQKQLVSFARAMAADRKILILDEATSSVDTYTDTLIQKAVPVLMKDRTSIVIAHRLSTIRKVDNIHVIAKGRIRESGTHRKLLKLNGIYAKLCKIHLEK